MLLLSRGTHFFLSYLKCITQIMWGKSFFSFSFDSNNIAGSIIIWSTEFVIDPLDYIAITVGLKKIKVSQQIFIIPKALRN